MRTLTLRTTHAPPVVASMTEKSAQVAMSSKTADTITVATAQIS
jgi:hypothetical protein